MSSNTQAKQVIQVSQKGQATIPKALREKLGIETPGEVFVYEEEGRIVIEPVPSVEELHGIHASEHEPGEVLDKVREHKDEERRREDERAERLRPSADEDVDE